MIYNNIHPNFKPPRQGDVKDSLADIERITGIGYRVGTQLNEGLLELLSWMRNIRTPQS